MMRTSAISELKPYKSMWMIKVKVLRLWKQYSAAGGETMEMVLIDSNVTLKIFFSTSVQNFCLYGFMFSLSDKPNL